LAPFGQPTFSTRVSLLFLPAPRFGPWFFRFFPAPPTSPCREMTSPPLPPSDALCLSSLFFSCLASRRRVFPVFFFLFRHLGACFCVFPGCFSRAPSLLLLPAVPFLSPFRGQKCRNLPSSSFPLFIADFSVPPTGSAWRFGRTGSLSLSAESRQLSIV